MRSQKYLAFELIFQGREPDLEGFSRNFATKPWALKRMRRLGPAHVQYFGGSPAELIVLVVSVTANILTIADILARRLAQGHDSIIRVGNREIRLQGTWKAEEIARIVSATTKQISKRQALARMTTIKSAKVREAKERLADLDGLIHEYEGLVQTFKDIPRRRRWQSTRAKSYRRRLTELTKERENIVSFMKLLNG